MFNQTKVSMKKLSVALAISTLFAMSAAPASAAVVNFDDVYFADPTANMVSAFPGNTYQGFNWFGGYGSNSWVISPSPSYWGFTGDKAHSGQNYAWSNGGTDLSLSKGETFDLNSFWGRAGYGGFTATAHGFNGATETYTQNFTVSDVYQLLTFNFLGIDRMTITNQGTNLLIDDINYNGGNAVAAVPEPETYAMLLAGLGLMGFTARRRKNIAV